MWPFKEKSAIAKLNKHEQSLESLWRLFSIMVADLDFDKVVYQVVNGILNELGYLNLGYRIVVLSLIDESKRGLRRIALSSTAEAQKATSVSSIPFEQIVIPFSATSNYCIRVLNEMKPLVTTYWPDLLSPPLTPEAALTNQKSAGIKTSLVMPVFNRDKPIGVLIFSMIKDQKDITKEEMELLTRFSEIVGVAVQNSMLYTSLKDARDALARVNVEVSRMNVQLQELDKLKDDFVSIASHELRTPMTAIRAYVWMALNRSDIPLSEKLKKYLQRTLVSTERLINLVNDMLNISRIESGRIEIIPRSFDLKTLVQDVLFEVEAKASEKNIHIKADAAPVPFVFADADKVHQVLLNLVGNALKFTPVDGEIQLKFFSDGNWLEVEVKDNGVGISREDLAKLFQKFGRLDNSYVAAATSGGTGLGLYICKSLINMMGGNIWAVSEGLGKGTSFIFSLPVANKQHLAESYKFTKKPVGEAKGLEPTTL